jgi:tripartite-type tricarboxylate transporter receptor subunit TctC
VFKKVSQDPEFKKSMDDLTLPIIYKGPEDLAKFYKETYDSYGKMVTEFGLNKK